MNWKVVPDKDTNLYYIVNDRTGSILNSTAYTSRRKAQDELMNYLYKVASEQEKVKNQKEYAEFFGPPVAFVRELKVKKDNVNP